MEPKNTFDHQVPTAEQVEKIKVVRESYKVMQAELLLLTPSREMSIAITNLEQSAMWAIKSIIFND